MKKIIALFTIMLAFGFSANAQKKTAAQPAKTQVVENNQEGWLTSAKADVAALEQVVTLDETKKQDFTRLFEHKYRNLSNEKSAERKAILSQSIEAKISASLTPEQNAQLAKHPELLKKLAH